MLLIKAIEKHCLDTLLNPAKSISNLDLIGQAGHINYIPLFTKYSGGKNNCIADLNDDLNNYIIKNNHLMI